MPTCGGSVLGFLLFRGICVIFSIFQVPCDADASRDGLELVHHPSWNTIHIARLQPDPGKSNSLPSQLVELRLICPKGGIHQLIFWFLEDDGVDVSVRRWETKRRERKKGKEEEEKGTS